MANLECNLSFLLLKNVRDTPSEISKANTIRQCTFMFINKIIKTFKHKIIYLCNKKYPLMEIALENLSKKISKATQDALQSDIQNKIVSYFN